MPQKGHVTCLRKGGRGYVMKSNSIEMVVNPVLSGNKVPGEVKKRLVHEIISELYFFHENIYDTFSWRR